jgi:hypothetical protein
VTEEEDLQDAINSATVADALKDGDLDALSELMDLLCARLNPKTAGFVLGIVWELLPEETQEKLLATAEAEGKSNVIDFFTRKPRL